MAVTRAEAISGNRQKIEEFSDFLDSFAVTPIGNQLGRVTNEKAVTQSIKNLVLTSFGERPFQPYIGCHVNDLLFENNNHAILEDIRYHIQKTLEINEPRAYVIEVSVFDTYDPNEIQINIIYSLINNPTPISVNLILKRVR
jgi:hypothetical protein